MDSLNMAYRRDRRSIREAYEEHFALREEMTFQRVVNIVERRTTVTHPELEYDRYSKDEWDDGSPNHHDLRGYRDEISYLPIDRGYGDEDLNFHSFRRNSPPPQEEGSYHHYGSNRDDGYLRRHVEIRSNGRAGPYHGRRGRGLSPPPLSPMPDRGDHKLFPPLPYTDCGDDHDGYRRREPYAPVRDRSPIRREALTPVSSGSNNNSSRSYSPERDKAYTYQQLQQRRYEDTHSRNREPDKPKASTSHTSSGSGDESSHSSVLIKENPAASVTESEEVVAAANTKPKLTPEEDFKARRAQAIADKALQVEELYRRDCQTFATVVKMLVAKKPSLDQLLQGPMKENLMEIKQRCLDDLKQFIKELDQVKMPEAST